MGSEFLGTSPHSRRPKGRVKVKYIWADASTQFCGMICCAFHNKSLLDGDAQQGRGIIIGGR